MFYLRLNIFNQLRTEKIIFYAASNNYLSIINLLSYIKHLESITQIVQEIFKNVNRISFKSISTWI